ncbi:hypothetical protein Leryth_020572, partial [Lithospermum erythrorhizon]
QSLDTLEEAKHSIKLATAVDVAIYSADVRDFGLLRMQLEQPGPIDVLPCSHGVLAQELEKSSLEDFRFIIYINLMGTFHVIKAAFPHMKNQAVKGSRSIAIVSSQAGDCGGWYTAYSASKFGIQGMAESLQQEVIGYDIHVSLIFPSDTDTPGMAIESKRRPEITSIIAASSSAMKVDEVAKISLDGIRSGRFLVPCNLEAFALCIVTAGMSPQRSVLKAFIEVTCAGITRIAALCFQWSWYESIEKWLAQRNQ